MKSLWKSLGLVLLALALMVNGSGNVVAQVPTTTVQDTVYRADGTPASGSVIVSWNAFTTAGGSAVPAGSTTATIGAGGVLTIALTPNAGSTPMGSYYTAVYHLNDGTTSREYWVVPVAVPGGTPAKLATIRNQVLPASVAMQTVSKQYVDNAIAAAAFGFPLDTSPYVEKAGDTMTGPLVLPADPATPNQAADKNYVDTNVASVAAGIAGKVAMLPSATQVVTQPTGTQLEVNDLNGVLYATQYLDVMGNDGIGNALASATCASGCKVVVEPTYPGTDGVNNITPGRETEVVDQRHGSEVHLFTDSFAPFTQGVTGESLEGQTTRTAPEFVAATGSQTGLGTSTLAIKQTALTGGSNQAPLSIETAPYAKSNYEALYVEEDSHTIGQHNTEQALANCYSVGDCIDGSRFITASRGLRDLSDEGTHAAYTYVQEDSAVFEGTCASGCTSGSTALTLTSTAGAGSQGDGRYLIDTNPAKVLSAGTLLSGGLTIFGTAHFSGTSFPVSVFLTGASKALSQPQNIAPGTITMPIATTGVTAGFATNTAALPASSGIACVADPVTSSDFAPNFETAPYTVVDGTHLQLTLNKVHDAGMTIAVGGLCGYGLEQTVDTANGVRQVFPVVGSSSATDLYYADGGNDIVGRQLSTSGYLNEQLTVAAIARSGNVVTVTLSSYPGIDLTGLTMTVSGVADTSYNGSYVVTENSPNTLTYANTGADSTSTGGSVSLITGGFALYPMAEVLSVYNTTTKQIDGAFTLAPNTVTWASGDTVEEPHYYRQTNSGDGILVQQTMPRQPGNASSGRTYTGTVGPGVHGWSVANEALTSEYLGGGGTHAAPTDAYLAAGVWTNDFEVDAGLDAILRVNCNLHGCNRWNSTYHLFDLQANSGFDSLAYSPQSDTVSWILAGHVITFAPSGITAEALNVGTLNATTITGGVSGSAITSGTIDPERLPVFGPSGTTHAVGAVPDPGATAGNTRYLREDGIWDVPAGGGGGGSPTGAAGGDLSGTYPNPTVAAIHATSGSASNLSSVSVGGTTAGVNGSLVLQNAAANQTLTFNFAPGYPALNSDSGLNMTVNGGIIMSPSGGVEIANSGKLLGDTFTGENGLGLYSNNFDGLAGQGVRLRGFGTAGWESTVAVVNTTTTHASLTLQGTGGQTTVGGGIASGTSANTDLVGTLTLASGSTTSASYTFTGTYTSAPVCLVQPQSATPSVVAALSSFSAQVTTTGLSVSVGAAPGSNVTFGYLCTGRN